MPKREIFDITVKLLHETDRAYLVTEDDTYKVWMPKSQCEIEKNDDGTYTLAAPTWLLQEKGLL